MKKLCVCACLVLLFLSCVKAQKTNTQIPCPEKINLLPLYGNVEKCPEQKEADKKFLASCDSQYPSRSEAAKAHVNMAWEYAEQNDRDMATKRFNQAWLLDSLNADVYWGLGIIRGSKQLYDEAQKLFEKSVDLNPNNEKVWFCLAVNNKEIHVNDDNEEYQQQRIQYLEKALAIDPNFYPAIQMKRTITKEDDGSTFEISKL